MMRVKLERRGTGWVAYLWGRSSPVLRPVPGNAAPAHAAWWPTREAAVAELTTMLGGAVEIVEPRRTP